jgi:hypothetical protein
MKKLFALTVIFALVLAACDDGNVPENGNAQKTTLTISNQSDINLFGVEYSSVDFGNIDGGRNSVKEVSPGTKYIYFSLQVNGEKINCRTDVVTCEEGEENNCIITNNTAVILTVSDRRDTLRNLYNTLSSIPGNVRVTTATENSISLTWNAVSGSGGYNIYRSTTQNGNYTKLNVDAITGTEFIDTTVSSNVVYWHAVSAIVNGTETAKSTAVSAVTLLPAPNNLTAEAFSDTTVSLAWNAVNNASSYNVYRSTSENGNYIKANNNAITGAQFIDTGILPATTYCYTFAPLRAALKGPGQALFLPQRLWRPLPMSVKAP